MLSVEFRKPRRKGKTYKTPGGLLPTGAGRTTAFEYRVAFGSEAGIRIEPEDDDKILADARVLCEYYLNEAQGKRRADRPLSEETERVLRTMADLTEKEESDPLKDLAKPDLSLDDLVFQVRHRLDLPSRLTSELLYRVDHRAKKTEGEWMPRRCREINYGQVRTCPLPRRLTLVLPNQTLNIGHGQHMALVDT